MSEQGNVLWIPATVHRLRRHQPFSYLIPSVMEQSVCFHICLPSTMLSCQVNHSCSIHGCRIFPPLDLCTHPSFTHAHRPAHSGSVKPHGIAPTSFLLLTLQAYQLWPFPPHSDNIINTFLWSYLQRAQPKFFFFPLKNTWREWSSYFTFSSFFKSTNASVSRSSSLFVHTQDF